jgi:hypothetical protein
MFLINADMKNELLLMADNYQFMGHSNTDVLYNFIEWISPCANRARPERGVILQFPVKESPIKKSRNAWEKPETRPSTIAPYGTPLPEGMPDFRMALQRDGLILLSWEAAKTEGSPEYIAHWVSSGGNKRRIYSSSLFRESEASGVMPNTSGRQGVKLSDTYQVNPIWGRPISAVVCVAPLDLLDSPGKRPEYIRELKDMGIASDFDYEFTLQKLMAAHG